MSEIPEGLYYTKEHEWLKLDGDTVTIGITDHAQHALTDIVYIELPDSGMVVDDMGEFAVVESVKSASPIFAPLSGEITEVNEELEDRINSNFVKSGNEDKIQFMAGDAADIIPGLNETFDLVFIDADKRNYEKYFDLIIDKVKLDGLIISDNVLWDGKVFDTNAKDLTTKAVREYNLKLKENKRIQTVLLPIRDGLLVARKIS